jgi:hypothetical protein
MVSTDLYNSVIRFEIGSEDQYTHLPQIFTCKCLCDKINSVTETKENHVHYIARDRERYKWTDESLNNLIDSDQIAEFYRCIDEGDSDTAVGTLVSLLQSCSKSKSKRPHKHDIGKQKPWWDQDLAEAKAVKHKCLRFFEKS